MCQMAGMDIDRLERMSPSRFMAELEDLRPGVYEHLYAKGFHTQTEIVTELRRQSQGGKATPCRTQVKRKIGKEAAAQNDS